MFHSAAAGAMRKMIDKQKAGEGPVLHPAHFGCYDPADHLRKPAHIVIRRRGIHYDFIVCALLLERGSAKCARFYWSIDQLIVTLRNEPPFLCAFLIV